MKVILKLAKT